MVKYSHRENKEVEYVNRKQTLVEDTFGNEFASEISH